MYSSRRGFFGKALAWLCGACTLSKDAANADTTDATAPIAIPTIIDDGQRTRYVYHGDGQLTVYSCQIGDGDELERHKSLIPYTDYFGEEGTYDVIPRLD